MALKSEINPTGIRVVKSSDLWRCNGHRGGVMWFTGLSGSGKSTLAAALEERLFKEGYNVVSLDGDNLRHGLNADLGFAPDDRAENIRRVGELAAMLMLGGMIVITAFISPYRADRALARRAVGEGFQEIFLDPGLEICEQRDPKGLYEKARAGEILDFTGISAPYEVPTAPELTINTSAITITESVEILHDYATRAFRLIT